MQPLLDIEGPAWHKLEDSLGYVFQNRELLKRALTHRSYANEFQTAGLADNERLEFLGDAVLDLAVSQYLMEALPDSDEGELTRIRADVVALPSLAALARTLEIGSLLLLGKGEERTGGRNKSSLLADALEAVLGAVFTDGGYSAAREVILPLFVPLLQQASNDSGQDFKSRLQEVLQARQRDLPIYQLVNTTGPAHERTYQVDVLFNNCSYGSGQGRTKKSAEQAAAKAALKRLEEET